MNKKEFISDKTSNKIAFAIWMIGIGGIIGWAIGFNQAMGIAKVECPSVCPACPVMECGTCNITPSVCYPVDCPEHVNNPSHCDAYYAIRCVGPETSK